MKLKSTCTSHSAYLNNIDPRQTNYQHLCRSHAHPRHAIALSFDTDLFIPGDLEGELHLNDVPVIAAGPMQTEQIANALQSRLIVILRGHGAYARGHNLWEALHWVTALEESAHIAWLRGQRR